MYFEKKNILLGWVAFDAALKIGETKHNKNKFILNNLRHSHRAPQMT
jgi:hypothetical protein